MFLYYYINGIIINLEFQFKKQLFYNNYTLMNLLVNNK